MANEGIIKKTTGEIAAKGKPKTLRDYIMSMQGEIAKALPSVITPERFTRMALTAARISGLEGCDHMSFLAAMMSAAQLGLEPNTPLGQAYILPYKNNKKGINEVQFQIGYKGLIDLAYRSGEVELVQAHCVYENDTFECEYGIEPKLKHIPADKNRGELTKVYAMFRTKSGGYGFEVMSIDDIRQHAQKYSKAFGSSYSPWKTSFEEMAKKTVLKRVLKYAPLKSDFVRAITQDSTVKSEINQDMYSVPSEQVDFVDTDFNEMTVDEQTGEVKEN